MADRSHPALASVTIRRLILPEAATRHGLGDAIAAALAGELGAGGPGVAQAIARSISGHPDVVGRTSDGDR